MVKQKTRNEIVMKRALVAIFPLSKKQGNSSQCGENFQCSLGI